MNNDELIAAGHELAKCLDSNTPLLDIAKLLSKMATQLDVTTAALREKTKQCEQIAQAVGWVEGGNFTLSEAVAGHVSGLKAAAQRSEELAAENAGLKAAFDKPQAYLSWHAIPPTWEDPLPCGEYLDVHNEAGHKNSDGTDCWPVYAKPEIETPATDAFLREVRASAVDAVCLKISNSIVSCRQDEMIGLDEAVNIARNFAAELRQGGAA
ncbi:hypothetical protein QLY72_21550 [Cronobacter malonaticus]|uniref:hypothetical protein n=1 Tax=Cronobacter malonaticus TaxID=413503 RepID=UPI0018F87CD8|nr:hypothetical protein [Cronobacter malonaticus]MDI7594989.1 hypothetical protein [Cronobacter malonaticus]